jgi:hypothetical protein
MPARARELIDTSKALVPSVTANWELWFPNGRPGDQRTVPEMWVSACVGVGFGKTSHSPICLTNYLSFSFLSRRCIRRQRRSYHTNQANERHIY